MCFFILFPLKWQRTTAQRLLLATSYSICFCFCVISLNALFSLLPRQKLIYEIIYLGVYFRHCDNTLFNKPTNYIAIWWSFKAVFIYISQPELNLNLSLTECYKSTLNSRNGDFCDNRLTWIDSIVILSFYYTAHWGGFAAPPDVSEANIWGFWKMRRKGQGGLRCNGESLEPFFLSCFIFSSCARKKVTSGVQFFFVSALICCFVLEESNCQQH